MDSSASRKPDELLEMYGLTPKDIAKCQGTLKKRCDLDKTDSAVNSCRIVYCRSFLF